MKRKLQTTNTVIKVHTLKSGTIQELDILREENRILTKNLKDRETLLGEIHHRIKNNLQIISSLLNLQMLKVNSNEFQQIIKESQDRIQSMALVHESLYNSSDFRNIDFKLYLKKLVSNISRSIGNEGQKIDININFSNIFLNISQAIPCGLILNEIITNSFKYAFPGIDNPKITISFILSNNKYLFTIEDNGIGLPKDFKLKEVESMGLHLVSILSKQLSGSVKVQSKKGTKFTITFPDKNTD